MLYNQKSLLRYPSSLDNSISSNITVPDGTKVFVVEDLDSGSSTTCQRPVSQDAKVVRFENDENKVHHYCITTKPSTRWYSEKDIGIFRDAMTKDVNAVRKSAPRLVKHGSKLYQQCAQAEQPQRPSSETLGVTSSRDIMRQRLVDLFWELEDVVGLERSLFAPIVSTRERQRNKSITILCMMTVNGFNGGRNHDESACAIASRTVSKSSRIRAYELALALQGAQSQRSDNSAGDTVQ